MSKPRIDRFRSADTTIAASNLSSHYAIANIKGNQTGKNSLRRASSFADFDRSRLGSTFNNDYWGGFRAQPANREPRSILLTDWVNMKVEIPKQYLGILYTNMLASIFTWLLLAGYIVLPVTFTSLRNSHALDSIGRAGRAVFSAVQNVSFLWIAGTCYFSGLLGLLWLCWENRRNYIWLTDRVFLPALLNSTMGLITTLVSVYTTQHGFWSITSVITAAVTAATLVTAFGLSFIYMGWIDSALAEHRTLNEPYIQ